jgi:hypothetical protein
MHNWYSSRMHPSKLGHNQKLAAALLVLITAMALPASASKLWNWNYSGSRIVASGTFTTLSSPNTSGGYLITGISGTRNGRSITGLQAPGTSIPGNEPYTVDDLVFAGPGPQLTSHGFGFSTSEGNYSNPFYADFLPTREYLEFFSMPGSGHTELPVVFSATPVSVPEPATYSLILGALALISSVGHRRQFMAYVFEGAFKLVRLRRDP